MAQKVPLGALYALAVRLQAHCKLPGCLVQSSGSCSPVELALPATAFVRGPRSLPPTACPTSLALGQVADEEEARRCHRLGRRTGTNAIGWLAGLVARLPLPWRAVQGQTHPLSLQAAVAADVSEESALLAAIAIASCCCCC